MLRKIHGGHIELSSKHYELALTTPVSNIDHF